MSRVCLHMRDKMHLRTRLRLKRARECALNKDGWYRPIAADVTATPTYFRLPCWRTSTQSLYNTRYGNLRCGRLQSELEARQGS